MSDEVGYPISGPSILISLAFDNFGRSTKTRLLLSFGKS